MMVAGGAVTSALSAPIPIVEALSVIKGELKVLNMLLDGIGAIGHLFGI